MTLKTRVHLIRHGEVENAGIPRYNGHADVALSSRGIEQYHQIKLKLHQFPISACYTSDLTRCRTGADIITEQIGLKPVVEQSLRELNIGIWEGMTWDEIQLEWPEEWQKRLADIENYTVPEGESLRGLEARVKPTINRIVAAHRGEEVLVVAHGGTNRVILLNAINAPLSVFFNIEQNYCCHNIIDYFEDGNSVVKLMNG
jgi:alpha-ribazole phosphatase